jgi:hypothetical protein
LQGTRARSRPGLTAAGVKPASDRRGSAATAVRLHPRPPSDPLHSPPPATRQSKAWELFNSFRISDKTYLDPPSAAPILYSTAHVESYQPMADYRSRAARPASSSTTYNPYGRGHLKLTGGTSGGAWRSDDVLATGESPALRQLRGVLRRLWTAATGGSFSPQTFQFIGLCALWYTTSALSSNTGKVILNRFRYPVTLTIVQFAFVSALSLLCMSPVVRMSHLRTPSRAILRTTLPMGMFQVGGHIFSSLAISRIPVSTVHTIKVGRKGQGNCQSLSFYSRRFLRCSRSPPTSCSSGYPTTQRPTSRSCR